MVDPLEEEPDSYNVNITVQEVEDAKMSAKNNKAAGYDNIPNEILKNKNVINVLCHMYQLCFDSGKTPSDWNKSIINPIPKDITKDRRIPLNYRGISLLSCISKIYSKILNKRMLDYAENNGLLCDEQNGFRRNRSCVDHIYVLNSVLKNRMNEGKDTYCAFIDFKKAFDFINRDLMMYRLLLYGYKGKLFRSVQSMYFKTFCTVKINDLSTEWFETLSGVKQGDCMSSTLFALYINDLALLLKSLNKGVNINYLNLSILLYADDIVLLAESEEDLQHMLNVSHEWCKKWRLVVNIDKSKIMHFRKTKKMRSCYNFMLGLYVIEYVQEYKYLGLVLNEHLNYTNTIDILAKAAGRALGACVTKFRNIKNMGFKTYTTIFEACVNPVLNYASEIWGFKTYAKCESIQLRAMKFFLGVNKYTPNVGVRGECGWISTKYVQWKNICKYWNRLQNTENTRMLYKVFSYDYAKCKNNWCSDVKTIFSELDVENVFTNLSLCSLDEIELKLKDCNNIYWENNVQSFKKLRTFVTFKKSCKEEKYLLLNLSRKERSLFAQLRLGVLPLRLETGRYKAEKEEERICTLCCSGEVENELHFLFYCKLYEEERSKFFKNVETRLTNFKNLCDEEKLSFLMTRAENITCKFICQLFEKRKHSLYK